MSRWSESWANETLVSSVPTGEFTQSRPASMRYGSREALTEALEEWLAKDPGFLSADTARRCEIYPRTYRGDLGEALV